VPVVHSVSSDMGFAVGRASSKRRVVHLVQDFATFAGGQARPFHVHCIHAVCWRLGERSASSDFHSRFAQMWSGAGNKKFTEPSEAPTVLAKPGARRSAKSCTKLQAAGSEWLSGL